MNRAEPLPTPTEDDTFEVSNTGLDAQETAHPQSVRESVKMAVRQYLSELDGQMSTDVYQMVLAEMEAPLLEEIMAYTRNNQTKASLMLGLNRGTLRKKLKQYNLISERN